MSYRDYQPSQLPSELMFRDAQIEMQVAQVDRLENRIKELEADNKNANAELDENHELIVEQSTCTQDLIDKLDAVEDKFRGIEAREKALRKDFDEMYETANKMIADRDGRIATLTMELARVPRPATPPPHPPFSPLTPPPRIRAAPTKVQKKRAPRAALIANVPELRRSGRTTRFRGSYKI